MLQKMKSKYKGTCTGCKRDILVGQWIRWSTKTKKAEHDKCFKAKVARDKAKKWNVENPILAGKM